MRGKLSTAELICMKTKIWWKALKEYKICRKLLLLLRYQLFPVYFVIWQNDRILGIATNVILEISKPMLPVLEIKKITTKRAFPIMPLFYRRNQAFITLGRNHQRKDYSMNRVVGWNPDLPRNFFNVGKSNFYLEKSKIIKANSFNFPTYYLSRLLSSIDWYTTNL